MKVGRGLGLTSDNGGNRRISQRGKERDPDRAYDKESREIRKGERKKREKDGRRTGEGESSGWADKKEQTVQFK